MEIQRVIDETTGAEIIELRQDGILMRGRLPRRLLNQFQTFAVGRDNFAL